MSEDVLSEREIVERLAIRGGTAKWRIRVFSYTDQCYFFKKSRDEALREAEYQKEHGFPTHDEPEMYVSADYLTSRDALQPVLETLSEPEKWAFYDNAWRQWHQENPEVLLSQSGYSFAIWLLTTKPAKLAECIARAIKPTPLEQGGDL